MILSIKPYWKYREVTLYGYPILRCPECDNALKRLDMNKTVTCAICKSKITKVLSGQAKLELHIKTPSEEEKEKMTPKTFYNPAKVTHTEEDPEPMETKYFLALISSLTGDLHTWMDCSLDEVITNINVHTPTKEKQIHLYQAYEEGYDSEDNMTIICPMRPIQMNDWPFYYDPEIKPCRKK
jgi:uncharacterized Zn finger protein (UPF0148 family)